MKSKEFIELFMSLYFGLLFIIPTSAQDLRPLENKSTIHRVVFYNVENYFDASFDSNLVYNDFTAEGNMHWTEKKLSKKTNSIYKVIQNISGGNGICLLGLCEIENERILERLIYQTPLKKHNYNYIHFNSKDHRGIDVALIYNQHFKPLSSQVYSITDDEGIPVNTRDILYVSGMLEDIIVHVFVNHWTSRYRGLLESKDYRMKFALLLKRKIDSIQQIDPDSKIIIMGDFNDQAEDQSMQVLSKRNGITNLIPKTTKNNSSGTVKYRSDWFIFDQVLVSDNLLNENNKIFVSDNDVRIYDFDFLLQKDSKYLGQKPYRTNIGFKYNGGYSDHLPIYFDLILVK